MAAAARAPAPIGVKAQLVLPAGSALAEQQGAGGPATCRDDRPKSIGRVAPFDGNFGMMVRAYAYIRRHGAAGLRANSEHAVLNANYCASSCADPSRCRSTA